MKLREAYTRFMAPVWTSDLGCLTSRYLSAADRLVARLPHRELAHARTHKRHKTVKEAAKEVATFLGGWMERTSYLSQVPIAVFFRYPLGHRGSAAYPDRPVVGVNPSFAWRGRKAESERQDAQQASSPSGVADHLPPLFSRLFSSSTSSADRQTTKLLFSPSSTFIDTQLSGQKHRER